MVDPSEEYKNERASYAYEISKKDKDFVLLLNAENGSWDHKRRSTTKYKRNGQWWSDEGMCQVSRYYFKDIVLDERWNDWKWQVQKCYELYKKGTRFYGWEHRKTRGKNIKFQ